MHQVNKKQIIKIRKIPNVYFTLSKRFETKSTSMKQWKKNPGEFKIKKTMKEIKTKKIIKNYFLPDAMKKQYNKKMLSENKT